MSTHEGALWKIQEHVIPASHPRAYHRGVRDAFRSRLQLHVKRYILQDYSCMRPDSNSTPLTIVFIPGVGSTKESYEPFLSSLVTQSSAPPIRQIFSFDCVDHGQSYLLNQHELGDEPHWLDPARDLLQLLNYFQAEVVAPVVGISQSAGANAVLVADSWSPRLFQAVVCIEPVVENGWWHLNEGLDGTLPVTSHSPQPVFKHRGRNYNGVRAFLRRDTWPSRRAAEDAFRRNRHYSSFDRKVLEKVFQYDLQPLSSDDPDGPVTLTTPSFLEAAHYMRLDPPLPGQEAADYATRTLESRHLPGFYSPGPALGKGQMGRITTRVLYVWAPENPFTNPKYHRRVTAATGTGLGGSGGVKTGQVDEAFVDQGGHTLPFDNPVGTARQIAHWLGGKWWQEWQKEQVRWREVAGVGKDSRVWAEWHERISKL